jgi:D-alanyl-D-alanine carboxypeptidase/D-alanyl-D-alanine carboxypeptidase (penicillin-binding protein 5/6)
MKTGFTKASGRCLVGAAERDGLTLVSVTLDAPDDWNDHQRLLDYGFAAYESVLLAPEGSLSVEWPCVGGISPSVILTNAEELRITLPRGFGEPTQHLLSTSPFAYAPVEAGETIATVSLVFEDSRQVSSPLLATESIPAKQVKKGFWRWLCDLLGR